MIKSKMLVVEDDAVSRELLVAYFTEEGFEVIALDHAGSALDVINKQYIDVCMIDIKLPGKKDGLTLAREIRTISSEIGIIMVTGKDELIDKIVGLESGADDYVTKPFEPRELLSRVKNLIRRRDVFSATSQPKQKTINFKGWTLDPGKRKLAPPEGEAMFLSEGEYQLLQELIENRGNLLTRDEIMMRIRNREWHPDDRYVDVLVVKLRQKFKRYDPDEKFITTVHGKGYIFEG